MKPADHKAIHGLRTGQNIEGLHILLLSNVDLHETRVHEPACVRSIDEVYCS